MTPEGNPRPSEMDVYRTKQVVFGFLCTKNIFSNKRGGIGYIHLLNQNLQRKDFVGYIIYGFTRKSK